LRSEALSGGGRNERQVGMSEPIGWDDRGDPVFRSGCIEDAITMLVIVLLIVAWSFS